MYTCVRLLSCCTVLQITSDIKALMPDDAPDASQLAVLQALCSSPNCLAALQVTLSAGLPGWADPILSAITQLLGDQELDLQLLATLLLRLENLSIEQQHVACLGSADQHSPSDGSDSDMAAGMEGMAGHPEAQQQQQPPIDGCIGAGGLENVATGLNTFMPSEVETAMQVCVANWHVLKSTSSLLQQGPCGDYRW